MKKQIMHILLVLLLSSVVFANSDHLITAEELDEALKSMSNGNGNTGNGSVANGNGNAFGLEKEKINKLQIINADMSEINETRVDNTGNVVIWMMINGTICDAAHLNKNYFLIPLDAPGRSLHYNGRANVAPDCKEKVFYESARFNFIGQNLSDGYYNLYRDYNGAPLLMGNIHIKGIFNNVVIAGEDESDSIDESVLSQIYSLILEFLQYAKATLMGSEEEFVANLDVNTVKWTRVGEEWTIKANYTDQHGKPITNKYCILNTDFWGKLTMNYDFEEKVYVVNRVAGPAGKMRWTVSCY